MILSSSVKVYPGYVRGWPLLSSSSNRSKRYHWYRGRLSNIICQRESNLHIACMPIKLTASRSRSGEQKTESHEEPVLLPHIYLCRRSRIIDVVGKMSTWPPNRNKRGTLKVITDPIAL